MYSKAVACLRSEHCHENPSDKESDLPATETRLAISCLVT